MKINWKCIGQSVGKFFQRRSPEILTGLGIAGMGLSVIFAVKATPKAIKALDDGQEKHKPIEVVKKTWKYYVPTTVSFLTSGACIIFSSNVHLRRNAALAAAYSVTEAALQDYRSAARDMLGEKKESLLEEKSLKKSIENNPPTPQNTFIIKSEDTLVYDPWSGRYFSYDIDLLKAAIEDLSYQLRDEEFVTLNEFYDKIHQDRTYAGEILGWNAAKGPIRPVFTSTLLDHKTPCLAIGFSRDPTEIFR